LEPQVTDQHTPSDPLTLLSQIKGQTCAPEASARALFLRLFAGIERAIQRRLALCSLAYDAGCEHYNTVFETVFDRVFAPQALPNAIADFDPALGSLDQWLLRRVDFVVRDWLRAVRARHGVQVASLPERTVRPATDASDESLAAAIEQAICALSSAQRACTVVRVLPARPITGDDLRVMAEFSGRAERQLHVELGRLGSSFSLPPAERSPNPADEQARWHARLATTIQLRDALRRQLALAGLDESQLIDAEERGRCDTQEGIRARYKGHVTGGRPHAGVSRWLERLELCSRDIERCRDRLTRISHQIARERDFELPTYAQIASLLQKTEASVTLHLHDARRRIEKSLNQPKIRDRFGLLFREPTALSQ
jgi:DNA-directed RNA polymerase specialized sigma24 family protein